MSGIIRALEELLKIVGQTNQVEFAHAIIVVQARRVHVAMDDAERVKVCHRRCKLPEYAKNLFVRKLVLAKLFPRGNVVRSLGLEDQSLNFVNEHDRLQQIEHIGVVHLLEFANEVHSVLVLLRVNVGDVHEDAHAELLSLRVPLDQDFTFIFG